MRIDEFIEISRKENILNLIEKVEEWSFRRNENYMDLQKFSGIIGGSPEYIQLDIESRKSFLSKREYSADVYYSPKKDLAKAWICSNKEDAEELFSKAREYFCAQQDKRIKEGTRLVRELIKD